MSMSPEHEARSRRWNARLRGSPAELLCARLYRNRTRTWVLVIIVDLWARVVWREEPGHCARMHARERRRRLDDPAARARLFEGQ
jgi:hypothetical protein